MRIKNFFFLLLNLLIFGNISALNIDSINLKLIQYQQEDKLAEWVMSYLEIESNLYENDKLTAAENTLDSIVLNAWRKPITKSENDEFFKVYWYKAYYLKDNGKMVKAKNHFEKALNYYSKSTEKYKEDLLIIYPPLGNIYTILGENEKAIIAHQKMITISNAIDLYDGKDDDLAIAYTNLAIVYETQNKLELAIENIEKVTLLRNVSNYNLGIALSNYGKFLYQQNKLNKAGKELQKAIVLLKEIPEIDQYFLGGIYKTMAFISIEKKNISVANQFLDLAIENYKKSTIVRNREIAKSYLEKSKISSDKIEILNIALQYLIPHSEAFPRDYFPSKNELFAENTLADIFYEETQLPLEPNIILKCFDYYFEVQKLIRKEYLFKNSKKINLQRDRKIIDEAIAFCYFMFSKNQEEKYAEKALQFIENEKSILLYESLANKMNETENDSYLQYFSTRKDLVNRLVFAQLNNDFNTIDLLKEKIKNVDFENEINLKNTNQSNEVLKAFQVQAFKNDFLQNNEALIVFHDAVDLFSIVVTHDKTSMFKTVKDLKFVNEISEYSNSFSFENRFNFDQEVAKSLGGIFNQIIPLNAKKIYLATDGILNNIPFESFKNETHYFIEKFEFQYIFSANILQNIKYSKVNNHQLLAIAPVFKNDSKKKLFNSAEEVENILSKINGKALINENATSETFINQAKEFAIIHISSHAQIDKQLQVASIDFFDKSLYFSQIEQEKFETELLVLSACETGVGKQAAGEGTLSLSKAFAYSKIPSIISSLWKVNEKSSLDIFNSFYANLKDKKSISTSLRNAKLYYLNNPKISEEKKQPYFWASFILLGEDNVLEVETNNNLTFVYAFLIALLLLFGSYFLRGKN